MPRTLILIFHPDFNNSRANRALADAASLVADTEIFDVQAAYPDNKINVAAEVERLLGAEQIVLQFPIQWYSAPPILQAWQNAVLTPDVLHQLRDRRPAAGGQAVNGRSDSWQYGIRLFPARREPLAPRRNPEPAARDGQSLRPAVVRTICSI